MSFISKREHTFRNYVFRFVLLSRKITEELLPHTDWLVLLDQENAYLSSSLLFPATTVFCVVTVIHTPPTCMSFQVLSISSLTLKCNKETSCRVLPSQELLPGPQSFAFVFDGDYSVRALAKS